MHLSTRRAQLDDLPQISEMIAALAQHHGDVPCVTPEQLRRDLFEPTPWFTVIVAQGPDMRLLGYAALTRIGQLQLGVRGMDMHHLFVHDDARGIGVGTALVDACTVFARSVACKFMMVSTDPDNAAAGLFYTRRGFTPRSGTTPRFSIGL